MGAIFTARLQRPNVSSAAVRFAYTFAYTRLNFGKDRAQQPKVGREAISIKYVVSSRLFALLAKREKCTDLPCKLGSEFRG